MNARNELTSMTRRSFVAGAIVSAAFARTGISPAMAQDADQPGVPPRLPDAEGQELFIYHNPYENAYIIAVEAHRPGGWDDFFSEDEDGDSDVADYVGNLEYVEDAEPVGLLDYGGKKTDGFFAGTGFIYDARDEADNAAAYHGYLSWEILGDMGYVSFASKEDQLYMVIGLQSNETTLEDILTWSIRDGELVQQSGDFERNPVVS